MHFNYPLKSVVYCPLFLYSLHKDHTSVYSETKITIMLASKEGVTITLNNKNAIQTTVNLSHGVREPIVFCIRVSIADVLRFGSFVILIASFSSARAFKFPCWLSANWHALHPFENLVVKPRRLAGGVLTSEFFAMLSFTVRAMFNVSNAHNTALKVRSAWDPISDFLKRCQDSRVKRSNSTH